MPEKGILIKMNNGDNNTNNQSYSFEFQISCDKKDKTDKFKAEKVIIDK